MRTTGDGFSEREGEGSRKTHSSNGKMPHLIAGYRVGVVALIFVGRGAGNSCSMELRAGWMGLILIGSKFFINLFCFYFVFTL
jgi:hypothetical protein